MHVGERSKQQYTRVMRRRAINTALSEQKQGQKQFLCTKIAKM